MALLLCAAVLPSAAAAQAFPTIRVGDMVRGTLTRDEPSFRDTPFRAYSFEAAAGGGYLIEMRSRDVDAFVTVARIVGGLTEYIAQNDDAEGTDARLYFRPDEPGTYVIVAATADGATGAFDLRIDEAVERRPEPRAAAIGSATAGALDRDSGFSLENGNWYDLYRFDATAGQEFVLALDSDAFDALLAIGRMEAGEFVELNSNDDADGTNSMLRWAAPSAGTYVLRAAALESGAGGAYTLTVLDAAAAATSEPVPIAAGRELDGELTLLDPFAEEEGYYDEFVYDAFSAHRIMATLDSDDFDPHLWLGRIEDGRFIELANNDDGNEGLASKLRYTLPGPGRYVLRVTAASSSGRGAYRIGIREIAPAQPKVALPIQPGTDMQGTIDEDDYSEDDDDTFETWKLTGTAGQRVTIAARSVEIDTYLSVGTLENGSYVELASNDDDVGTDSKLTVAIPQSGELLIRVSAFGAGNGGYTVRVDPAS